MTKGKGMLFVFTMEKCLIISICAAMLQFALELCYFVSVALRFNGRCQRLLSVASFGGRLVVPVEAEAVGKKGE